MNHAARTAYDPDIGWREHGSLALWLLLGLQAASGAGPAAPVRRFAPLSLTAGPGCAADSASGDVVVCGGSPDRYRLPLPRERADSPVPLRAAPATGMTALTPAGRCGIFAGERPCGKREKAEYGYGRGRDPLTVLTRLAAAVADPDGKRGD